MEVPLTFFSKGVKNWLIIQRISAYNFEVRGSSPMKLCHMTCHKGGTLSLIYNIWGHGLLKFGKAKNVQNFQI